MKVTKIWNILEVLVSSEQSQWRSNNQLCLKSSALCKYVCSHLTVRPNTTSVAAAIGFVADCHSYTCISCTLRTNPLPPAIAFRIY